MEATAYHSSGDGKRQTGVDYPISRLEEEIMGHIGNISVTQCQNPHLNYDNFYKGATHVHTNLVGGGEQPPGEVASAYRAKGFNFVFITDHNRVSPGDLPATPGILCFRHHPSLECGKNCSHHILVLGIDRTKVDTYAARYNLAGGHDPDPDKDGECGWKTGKCANIFRRLHYYNDVAMAVVAHPHDKHADSTLPLGRGGWLRSELLNPKNRFTGIEVFNASCAGGSEQPFAVDWWDEALQSYHPAWAFAGDDCHNVGGNRKSFNRAWIVVNSAKTFEITSEMESDLLLNIRSGNFYAVVRSPEKRDLLPTDGPPDLGPRLTVRGAGSLITATIDQPGKIAFRVFSDANESRITTAGEGVGVTQASIAAGQNDKYVRIEVDQIRNGELYRAYSQPLFVIKANPS